MTTALSAPVPSGRRRGVRLVRLPRSRRRALLALVVIPVLVLLAASHLVDRVDRDRRLEPLRAARLAASAQGERIATVPTALGERWSSSTGPREDRVRALLGSASANRLLEAPFLALEGGLGVPRSAVEGARCYYLGVQDGGEDLDVRTASGLLQICYRDPEKDPVTSGYVGVPD